VLSDSITVYITNPNDRLVSGCAWQCRFGYHVIAISRKYHPSGESQALNVGYLCCRALLEAKYYYYFYLKLWYAHYITPFVVHLSIGISSNTHKPGCDGRSAQHPKEQVQLNLGSNISEFCLVVMVSGDTTLQGLGHDSTHVSWHRIRHSRCSYPTRLIAKGHVPIASTLRSQTFASMSCVLVQAWVKFLIWLCLVFSCVYRVTLFDCQCALLSSALY